MIKGCCTKMQQPFFDADKFSLQNKRLLQYQTATAFFVYVLYICLFILIFNRSIGKADR